MNEHGPDNLLSFDNFSSYSRIGAE